MGSCGRVSAEMGVMWEWENGYLQVHRSDKLMYER